MLSHTLRRDFPPQIGGIQFGILAEEEIDALSVVEVTETVAYSRNVPRTGGLLDSRMGCVDRRILCSTCQKSVTDCQGHPGKIKFAFPMYHVSFFDNLLKVLRSVCFVCSRVCVEASTVPVHLSAKARFAHVTSLAKGRKRCPHCGAPKPTVTRLPFSLRVDWPEEVNAYAPEEVAFLTAPFTQKYARSVLEHVPEADVHLLGMDPHFAHPREMVLTSLLVCPPSARPAIMASEGSRNRGQDDLTLKLMELVRRNNELRAILPDWREAEALSAEATEAVARLQAEVFTYVTNNVRGQKPVTLKKGQVTKSLVERLKGKEGRIRSNLMGKRVNFSARSVITPDVEIDLDELGVPLEIAKSITVPEKVCEANIVDLTQRCRNGPDHVFGAQAVLCNDGTTIQLALCVDRPSLRLQYGFVVERHLQDGDVVVFNRQPSLHKMSMMGHRVRLMAGLTFRINLCAASPYNADFDGDEMNMHAVQGPHAAADVVSLMMVGSQLLSPQSNRPVMGIVQDALLGAYRMSEQGVLLGRERCMELVASLRHRRLVRLPEPCVCDPPLWSGKQLLSLLFEAEVNVNWQTDPTVDRTTPVVLGGALVSGLLTKRWLGTSTGGVVDVMARVVGVQRTTNWMSDLQRMVNRFNVREGFNVSIRDCVISEAGATEVDACVARAFRRANFLLSHHTEEEEQKQVMEGAVMRILSQTLVHVSGIVDKHVAPTNAIRAMIHAGSKGSPINIAQICGVVSQQSVSGARIFSEKGGRTLSSFAESASLEQNGYVRSAYARGLSPSEYFFHAMGGREGLVDTAVKTAVSGYIQRRQVKSMEDFAIAQDGTVRSSEGEVVDFVYGGDGYDPSRLERVTLSWKAEAELDGRFCKWEAAILREAVGRMTSRWREEGTKRILSPVNPLHLLLAVEQGAAPLSPPRVKALLAPWLARHPAPLRLVVLDQVHTRVVRRRGFSEAGLTTLLAKLEYAVCAARVQPGEAVGSIAAQSIGEPATQMTLNTFHSAGIGNRNVVLGIPRLKEILDHTRNMRTPSNTVHLVPAFARSDRLACHFADTLPLVRFGDLVQVHTIFEEPVGGHVEQDAHVVRVDHALDPPGEDVSDVVVRFVLDRAAMEARRLTPPQLRHVLQVRLDRRARVASSETNDVEWILRVRYRQTREMMRKIECVADRVGREILLCNWITDTLLTTCVVTGNPHIHGAQVRVLESGERVVDTQGTCLVDLSAADCVCWERTTSNCITEVAEVLGIEAACRCLFDELYSTLSSDGTYVDPRHMTLICNTMTRNGGVMSLSRHGLNRMNTGPLLRCSFEETPEVLADAACFSEHDSGKGVSQSIMLGNTPSIGSGRGFVKFADRHFGRREMADRGVLRDAVLKSRPKATREEEPAQPLPPTPQPPPRRKFRPRSPSSLPT